MTGIDDLSVDADQIKLYPNPSRDLVHLELQEQLPKDLQLSLVDQAGRLFSAQMISKTKSGVTLNTKNFPGGLYLVRIVSDEVAVFRKLLIMR